MTSGIKVLLFASAALAAAVPGYAFAQTRASDTVQTAGGSAIEEVVVTARKTSERIEDVPLSITSYDTKELASRGISGLKDIAEQTPGFVFQTYSSSFDSSPTIRGLTQFDVTSSVANVSTVVNGVYIPRNYSVDLDIADISRIDIVKGPQSALYGGNAFAGVISYTLAPTTTQPHADVSLTGGTAGRFDGKVDASGSLLDGKLQARGYFGSSEYDGTWKNNYPVTSGSAPNLGGYNKRDYGFALKYTPTSKIEADLNYFHLDRREDIKPDYNVTSNDSSNSYNCGKLICGQLSTTPDTYQSAKSTRPSGLLLPGEGGFTSSTDFLDAQLKFELAPNLNATYLFGHVRSYATEVTSSGDNPVSGISLAYSTLFGPPSGYKFLPLDDDQKEGGVSEFNSHELRFDYSIGHFKALLGFYYSDNEDSYKFAIGQATDGDSIVADTTHPFDFTGIPLVLESHHLNTDTTAEFGRLAYSLVDDRLTLAVELRHSSDHLDFQDSIAKLVQKATFDETTPRFTADFKLTPQTLVYASAAKGVKQGGFNGVAGANGAFTIDPAQQTFQPESNWTYEVGTKNSFLGGRAVINADLFLVKWSDLQIQEQPSNTPAALAGTTSVITTNLGAATSYGLETDGRFAVTSHLNLNYALALIDPTFDSGVFSARFKGICNGVDCPVNDSVAGKTLPRTSKVQAAGGATWSDTFLDKYHWDVHGEFTYQSKQQVEEENVAQIQDRLLFNASATIRQGNLDLTVWGKNIFDKKYVADSFFVLVGSVGYSASLGERATGGVTLNYHY